VVGRHLTVLAALLVHSSRMNTVQEYPQLGKPGVARYGRRCPNNCGRTIHKGDRVENVVFDPTHPHLPTQLWVCAACAAQMTSSTSDV
jgi:hypothetical protein